MERNIYDNFKGLIELCDICDIDEIFLRDAYSSYKTIGVIANKDLILYLMEETLKADWACVKKLNMEYCEDDEFNPDDFEYMISIDCDGDVVVQPIEYYKDEYFEDMDKVYISYDGDVTQLTIDHCLDYDMDVYLFGYVE